MSEVEARTMMKPSSPLAERADDLLLRLADAIRAPDHYGTPFLGHGSILNSLVLQEAYDIRKNVGDLKVAASHLNHAMDQFDKIPLSSSLYRGITGLGWAVQTFSAPKMLPSREAFLADLDMLLMEGVEVTRNPNVDIINGLAGISVYALARGEESQSSRALWRVIDGTYCGLLQIGRIGDPASGSSAFNNFGLAHGIPGLLAVAAIAVRKGFCSDRVRQLVIGGLDALWSNAFDYNGRCAFATRYGIESESRLAWCYGSLGLAATYLIGASLRLDNRERFVRLVEAAVSQYKDGEHGIRDASLCHGHSGVALSASYFLPGLQDQTGLSDAVEDMMHHAGTLALDSERKDQQEIVFTHWTNDGPKSSMSFLEGAPGVALAMVAACSGARRPWMQLLGYF